MKPNRILGILPILLLALFLTGNSCSRLMPAPDYEDYNWVPADDSENQQQPEQTTTPPNTNQPRTNRTQTQPPTNRTSSQKTESGKASYYSDKFQGRPTASGEAYDRNKLTAAHRTLPFGTLLKVTNVANGKSINVRVNDRGPHVQGRVVDLSYQAMVLLDGIRAGMITVTVEVLE